MSEKRERALGLGPVGNLAWEGQTVNISGSCSSSSSQAHTTQSLLLDHPTVGSEVPGNTSTLESLSGEKALILRTYLLDGDNLSWDQAQRTAVFLNSSQSF